MTEPTEFLEELRALHDRALRRNLWQTAKALSEAEQCAMREMKTKTLREDSPNAMTRVKS